MASVVEATCPGCKKTLRIPADWVHKTLRCKKCGATVQITQSVSSTPTEPSSGTVAPELTVPEEKAFALNQDGPIICLPAAGQSSRGFRTSAFVLGCALLSILGIAMAYRFWPPVPQTATIPALPKKNSSLPPVAKMVPFPRRILAISVNDYLYANPVGALNAHALVERLVKVLHVPISQVIELSDAGPRKSQGTQDKGKAARTEQPPDQRAKPALPLKPVMEQTIRTFLETSRPQDRILILFVGHVIEIGGEAFLVPLEGELTAKETLIPLGWFYEQLGRCKARQKVFIVDTCRLDPIHGQERPGSGPMSETLAALLGKPPAGVEVWSACTAGQYSYVSFGSAVFLDRLDEALKPSLEKEQQPQDPLPIEALAHVVNPATATEAALRISTVDGQKAVQTPRLTGQPAEQGTAYDPDEPLPQALDLPSPPPAGGVAKLELVRSIVQEIELPALKRTDHPHTPAALAGGFPFSTAVLERYRPDYGSLREIEQDAAKYPLRVQVLQSIQLLRTAFDPNGPQGSLREYFQGASNERIKAEILKEQRKPALVHEQLTERLEALRKAGEQRDKEPSLRWQAHFDYILAQLLARTAYVSEYNLMLGKIRKDELPELQPKVHTGWRLASSEKLQSGKEVKDLAAESKKQYAKVIHDYPGTPWEVLAKREQLTALGLEWQPSP
ncbi:MAG TPA: hypothetical protein VKU02_07740 [Gemmataceae bacterium]|nr:hypothetical protein [Gemmataceae bacterium]